jgi:transposase InsO family protein
VKYAFIREHENEFKVARMCAVLHVSRSGYYDWIDRPESRRAREDRELLVEIRRVHLDSRRAYGSVKTWMELRARGVACGKHRVARLRSREGIRAQRRARFRITVENQHTAPAAPNLVLRQFGVPAPNRIWVGDMTFVRTRAGFLYLAVLLDLYARNVVGWAMHDRPNLEVTMRALDMALVRRRPAPGLVHHTDQAVLYSATPYRERMRLHGLIPSMSRRGDCYDNAVAESFFSNLKNELVHHCDFVSREAARAAIFDYIEVFYNRRRRHQTLGYLTPVQFEQRSKVA